MTCSRSQPVGDMVRFSPKPMSLDSKYSAHSPDQPKGDERQINDTNSSEFLRQHTIIRCARRLEEMCSKLNVTGLEVIKRKLNVRDYCA